MPDQLELHHSVRERFGEVLCYYFLQFAPPYDFEKVRAAIGELFAVEKIETYSSYEIFGAVDVIVRSWLPSTRVTTFEHRLADYLRLKNCTVIVSSPFFVTSNPYHYLWPDGLMALLKSDNNPPGNVLDEITVADIHAAEGHPVLLKYGLLREVKDSNHSSIRLFIGIPPSSRGAAPALMNALTADLTQAIKESDLRQVQLYNGVGPEIALLIDATLPVGQYFQIGKFNVTINELGLHRFGLKTTTYLTTSPDVLSKTGMVIESSNLFDEFHLEKTALEYLEAGESESLEHKGSIELDIKRYLVTDQLTSNAKLQEQILATIVAFLNSKGGELVIGAIEQAKFEDQLEKAQLKFPPVGEMLLVGIELEYELARDKNWDGYTRRLTDWVARRIGASYTQFIRFRKLPVQIAGNERNLCVIQVWPLSRGEVAYLNDEECYIRAGASTRSLKGRELELFLSRKR